MGNSIPKSKRMSCAGCGKDMWKSRTSKPEGEAKCLACRRSLHNSARYDRGCRCEVCRAAKNESIRAYTAKRKAEGRPVHLDKRTVARDCDSCGVEFQARADAVKVGKGRFCSPDCHNAHQLDPDGKRARARENARVNGAPGSVRWRALRRARAALRLSGGNRVMVQGSCAVCGDEFTGLGAAARYCSDECRPKARKKNSFGISFLDRMFLYSRDRWTCHLCGMSVDPAADELSNEAASLDHVVPQSRGGSHEFENLKLAHRICNSVRRDVPLDEFLTDAVVADLRARLGVSNVSA